MLKLELQSCMYTCEKNYNNYGNKCTDAVADGTDAAPQRTDVRNNQVTLKHCRLFIDFISKINNTQVDNAKDPDVVMLMYTIK